MEGFQELAFGGTPADIWAPLVGTLAIGIVTGAMAWVRSQRMVAR